MAAKIIQFPNTRIQEVNKTTLGKYQIGQKIYNRGDMANRPGWFEITDYKEDRFGKRYDLKEIGGEQRTINAIPECAISEIDKGNGSTRFVTEKAYNDLRNKQLEQLQEMMNKHHKKENRKAIKGH